MAHEEKWPSRTEGEGRPEELRPASLASKEELLARISHEAIFGNEQTDGSMDVSLVVINSPEEDEFDDELDITLCPKGEISVDGTNEELALLIHDWRYHASQESNSVYHIYHFIDDPEGLKVLRTSKDRLAEKSVYTSFTPQEQDMHVSLYEELERTYHIRNPYKNAEVVSESDVKQLIDMLSEAKPRVSDNERFDKLKTIAISSYNVARFRFIGRLIRKIQETTRNI